MKDCKMGGFSPYLPIEAFRRSAAGGEKALNVRRFLSSGTSSGGERRAVVTFSAAGIAAYRDAALSGFYAMLAQFDLASAPGLSLIPRIEDWPDSSLAQMVAWIAAQSPVRYTASIPTGIEEPIWVFGTAFHFVHLLDAGAVQRLPEGSLLIETGGTKGKSRHVERAAFYRELTRAFGVPEERIVSEYGMCELASQAYDSGAVETRRFRFPPAVEIGVVTGPDRIEAVGTGLLIVKDPRRLDVPLPIRTEDVAEVFADGSFRLLGRAAGAPLKGCSLLAADVVAAPAARAQEVVARPAGKKHRTSVLLRVEGYFASAAAEDALSEDLGSRGLARVALEDLRRSLPNSMASWPEARDDSWLLVLPRSHPLAGLHPIAVGVATGRRLTVRQTPSVFLDAYLALFPEVARLEDPFRIATPRDVAEFDAVLAFGDDATIAAIRDAAQKPVVGFGQRAGISVLHADETRDPQVASLLARDAFSLNQAGCMSSRLAVVIGEDADVDALARHVANATRALHGNKTLPRDVNVGLELERARLSELDFTLHLPLDSASPLLASTNVAHVDLLARRAYSLPVLCLKNASIAFASTVRTVTASPQTLGWLTTSRAHAQLKFAGESASFRPLGAAHAAPWNGTHEGRPLFAI